MKRSVSSLLCLSLAVCALAQQPDANVPMLKAGTRVVVVDVVVTDRQGNPVHDLPAGVFTVTEDNKPQIIAHFQEHRAAEAPAPLPAQPVSAPGIFTNVVPITGDTPLTVVLLDTLNTPLVDQMYARSQLVSFIKKLQPGSRIAIMTLTTRLNLLQGFTSDPAVLQTALKKSKSTRVSSLREDNITSGFADQPTMGGLSSGLDAMSSEAGVTQLRMRKDYTADAFNQLARFLSGYPGRKNVIWFSGGFPISIGPGGEGDPFASVVDFGSDVQNSSYMMSLAQIAVYPVDVRGVIAPPIFSAETSSRSMLSGRQMQNSLGNFNSRVASEQMLMRTIAEDTGGKAYTNNNDLSGIVRKVMNDGANFYTLDYVPSDHNLDGQYHSIHVSLQAPGYNLSYRRGYVASVDKKTTKTVAATRRHEGPESPEVTPMKLAMQHGSPSLMQVAYRERFTPMGTDLGGSLQQTLAPGNSADPKLKPPYRTYEITYAIDAHTLAAPLGKDGKRKMRVEYTALVYGEDSTLQTATGNSIEGSLTDAEYQRILNDGLQLHQQISVPAKGEQYIRTGVHDLNANTIGTLEIDAAQLKALPPMAAVR
ncbi:MAG: VWA domain-containing protein [Acidobacteria bacterium]|nr:VWA domain-containing protein [Acidobacteriota bacterium]